MDTGETKDGLTLNVNSGSQPSRTLEIPSPRLVLAAYTACDGDAVARHIDELAETGVPPPLQIPEFYAVPSWLLLIEPAAVEVASWHTSGEAEPVLIKLPSGELYVGVGSDHTDRHLERASVLLSKQVCPKVLGRAVWPFEQVAERWDALRLSSEVGPGIPYQDDSLGLMKPPLELLRTARERFPVDGNPLVLFLGTVPLKNSFVFDSVFTAEIHDPVAGQSISCRYEIEVIGVDADEQVL